MTRHESIIITALLTVFLGVMCIPDLSSGAYVPHRKRPPPPPTGIQCTAMQDKFYVRNRCQEGFVSVSARNKVIVQQTGLNISHPAVAIMKETCTVNFTSESPLSWKRRPRLYSDGLAVEEEQMQAHFVRYRHHKSKRYICFDRNGKVKAVSKRRVERKGSLCLFEEKELDRSFHTIRSMYNPTWHLAFNYRRPYKESGGNKALPSRRGQGSNSRKCDAQFHSGKVEAEIGVRHEFSGIFDQILHSDGQNTSQNHNVHNSINERISKVITDDNNNDDNTVNRAVTTTNTQLGNKMLSSLSYQSSQNMIPDSQAWGTKLQNVWAVTTRPQPKMRHIRNKRPRLSRRQKNRIKKMRRYKARTARKLSNYSAKRGNDSV